MSLYNMIHGYASMAPILLKILDVNPEDIGRFRDCYKLGDKIVIYTRMGGGNREDYENEIDSLRAHSLYEYDEDDDFDCTYAAFYFSIPQEYKTFLAEAPDETLPRDKWEMIYKSLSKRNEK